MKVAIAACLLILSTFAQAEAAWTAAKAKNEAERAVGTIIEGRKMLKYAIQAKDKVGWENWVIKDFDRIHGAFLYQRMALRNKNVVRYLDCESALLEYKFYSESFFRPDSMMNLQSRDVNDEDFKKDFSSCKDAVGWRD